MADVRSSPGIQQVHDEHDEIRDHIQSIREFLERDRPEIGGEGYHHWAADLSGSLVKLHEQLVQGLFPLVMAAAQAGAPVSSHGIDLVDKDYAGSVFLPLNEQVPHAGGAHPYKHLDEIRSGNGKEGNVGLTRHSLGEQCLARTRSAHQQNALGDLASQAGELLWVS